MVKRSKIEKCPLDIVSCLLVTATIYRDFTRILTKLLSKEKTLPPSMVAGFLAFFFGGDKGIRTPDLLTARYTIEF